MTDDDLDTAAHHIADRLQRQDDYVRFSTALISSLPIIYGILTWVFGPALWASSPVYRTALQLPWAPQSWGTAFITFGVLSVWFGEREKNRAMAVVAMLTAVCLSMFMAAFAAEAVSSRTVGALPPCVVYGIFSLAFLNRSRLAWQAYTMESGWRWEESRLRVYRNWRLFRCVQRTWIYRWAHHL